MNINNIKSVARILLRLTICAAILTALLSAQPETAEAQDVVLKLARVLAYQKKYDESLVRYRQYLKKHPNDYKAHLEVGDVYFWNKQYDKALDEYKIAMKSEKLRDKAQPKIAEVRMVQGDFKAAEEDYRAALAHHPKDNELRIKLAQVLSYDRKYQESIAVYEEILRDDPANRKALLGLAEVLSWDEQYDKSLAAYDELLAASFDAEIALQRARVLGWAKRYGAALAAYDAIYEKTGLETVKMEREAKQAYWNGWVLTALERYRQLLAVEPGNHECRTDLAQLEGYQRMWKSSREDYSKILEEYPNHLQAKDGLEKVNILSRDVEIEPNFMWFRARSDDRNVHINWMRVGANAAVPLSDNIVLDGGYAFDLFMFDGESSIKRHQGSLGLEFDLSPDVWGKARYLPTGYTFYDRMSHLFEGSISGRPIDPIVITAFTERDDLINNRDVFNDRIRTTDFGGRIDASVHRRWKVLGEYRYSDLNDGNRRNAFYLENLLYIMFEPKRFTANLRVDFQDYRNEVARYFSPSNFWAGEITLHWRHYLNPYGLYFGAKDTYYGIKYKFRMDREKVVFNGGAVEFHKDIKQWASIHFEGFGLYSSVYYNIGSVLSLAFWF